MKKKTSLSNNGCQQSFQNKEKIHYVHPVLYNHHHPINIKLIGVGGTGCMVLRELGRINVALQKLERPGIHVIACDPDVVSESNVGRQLFLENDIGKNKAVSAISKINRVWGTSWIAEPIKHEHVFPEQNPSIIISCVDSVEARRQIVESYQTGNPVTKNAEGTGTAYYLIDAGNGDNFGQVQVMTLREVKQPKKTDYHTLDEIKSVLDIYPKKSLQQDGPSCSLAQALGRQDLMVNSMMANTICVMLWQMLRHNYLMYRGAYINLADLTMRPILLG